MRISDWSSDVCSSDLGAHLRRDGDLAAELGKERRALLILRTLAVHDVLELGMACHRRPSTKVVAPTAARLPQPWAGLRPRLYREDIDEDAIQQHLPPGYSIPRDRKSTRLNSSHSSANRMPS